MRKGDLDPFAVAVMEEIGLDIARHKPMTFEELEDWEGSNFDLIVTLSPEAHHRALELTRTIAAEVEYWPTLDPTDAVGIATSGSTPIAPCATSCAHRAALRRRRRRNEPRGPVVESPDSASFPRHIAGAARQFPRFRHSKT